MPLKAPTISALARQTIRTAFDDLDRTITPVDSRGFHCTTLQHVRKAALEIENQLAARQSLRNMRRLAPLFNGLEHYSKVVDVLCNGTPFLAWIWAPITLILRVSLEYVEAFEHIIKGYSKVAESLVRFEILGDAFRSNLDFQHTIAVFYADILQFHKHAYKFVKRSGWKLMFLTSWGRFQSRFDNILEDMKRHGELVDKEANAYDIAEAQQMRQDIRSWREESLEQVERIEKEQAAKQYKSIMSWLKANESDQLTIFDAISAEGAKFPGTCSWILRNTKIKSWLEKKADYSMLWLQGTPGSGKSVLSTQIVTFMNAAKMFVIHHFCVHSYASSTMYEQILRSLLLQLLQKDCEITAHVYEDCVLGKKPPAVQALERLLKTLLANTSHEPRQTEYIWIVIDGLDECEAQTQASVVNFMNQLTSKTSSFGGMVCKVLVSSRSSSITANRLRGRQVVSLTEEKSCLDIAIKQYASQRLQSLDDKLYQLDIQKKEVEDIELEITKKADGMFLYARLVLDYLAKNIFYSGEEMRISVQELPDQLSEFYRRILSQILIQLDARSVNRVRCIFGWIAFAKRPLKRMEFLSAITFSSGDPKVSHIAPQYILDTCGALLEERRDTTLSFIHVSVKDFLQSPSSNLKVTEHRALIEHGKATITCLLSGLYVFALSPTDRSSYIRVLKGLHGFHVYATEYWWEYLLSHAADLGPVDDESDLLVLAKDLAQKLDKMFESAPSEEFKSDATPLDDRLELLNSHPLLQKQVRIACKARSLNRLESELRRENYSAENCTQSLDGISAILLSYQEALRFLLRQDDYPGVTVEELEFFKSQFRTSAYTCRLSSCPRTTVGFESEELLREHEVSHTRRIVCLFADCKYPPFVSVQAMKKHVNKYHNPNPAPISIRKVGHILTKTTATNFKKRANLDASITNPVNDVNWMPDSALDASTLVRGRNQSGNQNILSDGRRVNVAASFDSRAFTAGKISSGLSNAFETSTRVSKSGSHSGYNGTSLQRYRQAIQQAEATQQQRQQPNQAQVEVQSRKAQIQEMMKRRSMQDERLRSMPEQAAQQGFPHPQHQRQDSPIPGHQPPQALVELPNQGLQAVAQNHEQQFPDFLQEEEQQFLDLLQAEEQQQLLPIPVKIQQSIYQSIYAALAQQTKHISGWQSGVLPNERMGLIFNIIENIRLASRHQPNAPTIHRMTEMGIGFEKDIFEKSPNKEQYRHQVALALDQILDKTKSSHGLGKIEALLSTLR
ncbi:hypothetical protein EG329_012924 [Mollisiaceae sp. DMI_Dod_QoI]|nr:hypothetical protein EG329_012924 [Helotiales sp. DMI_Dod_QoI]